MKSKPLNKKTFLKAIDELREMDPVMDDIVRRYGLPAWRKRQSGFPTLVRIILEQQVSLASGRAVYQRLRELAPRLTPASFLKLSDEALRSIGFSRQKIRYCRILAETIKGGGLSLRRLEEMDDQRVHDELTKITGIGRWTADIYLMEGLKRPDIWPVGDLALVIAARRVLGLKKRPTPERLEKIGRRWKPWRSVAARLLWHFYLSAPKDKS